MGASDRICEYCDVASMPCDGTQDCSTCTTRGLFCEYRCDSDTDSEDSDPSFDSGWETFYARQARILIMETNSDNLSVHLPLIRSMWAHSSDQVRELYWEDEAGRMTLAKGAWNSPIHTMRGIALYAAQQFQHDEAFVNPDPVFWLMIQDLWAQEPEDVQEFWEDMARDRMAHLSGVRLLSVIPPPRPVSVDDTAGRTIYSTDNVPAFDIELAPVSHENEFAHLFDTSGEAVRAHFGSTGPEFDAWVREVGC